jgi:L-2-amino-thiazoline-4-carboxylic acid hydrolase
VKEEECIGIGDIKMSDLMSIDDSKAVTMFRSRFKAYRQLADKFGEDAAFEKMMEKYPAQQKAFMGAFIDNTTLAKGFNAAKPVFRLMGFEMEVVDISQEGKDAVLEIQYVCPVLSVYKEYGLESPCRVLCDMEQEATRRAFPGVKASILSRKSQGDCVCVFKYERPATSPIDKEAAQSTRVADWVQIFPKLIQMFVNVLKGQLSR